jgi:hypothetical protein
MKKRTVLGLAMGLASLLVTSTAYPWNYATHAFIAGKIGKALPVHNYNEMYGLMAPDILNFEFSLMNDSVLRGYTHGIPQDAAAYYPYPSASENFMSVWDASYRSILKSAAYGFVAHNDAWGADFVAHWRMVPTTNPIPPASIPFPLPIVIPPGHPDPISQPPGYIIWLAAALDAGLAIEGAWEAMGFEDDYATRLMFCHNIIEYAGDLVIKRVDPLIGRKLVWACHLRSPQFEKLLEKAFPDVYDEAIEAAEPEYREFLTQYGLILLQPEGTAIEILAGQLADLAVDYLIFLGLPPEMVEPMRPQLVAFGIASLTFSIDICENADDYIGEGFPTYMQELNQVTVPWVGAQLEAHGIIYWF